MGLGYDEGMAIENGPVVQERHQGGFVEYHLGGDKPRYHTIEYAFLRDPDITLLACPTP
jgi:hypothetical protein